MIWYTAIPAVAAAWVLASRFLFRRWIQNDTIMWKNEECDHGFESIHHDRACHRRSPAPRPFTALAAIITVAAFPVSLFILAVVSNPPQGRRELEARTQALLEENEKLRAEQERQP